MMANIRHIYVPIAMSREDRFKLENTLIDLKCDYDVCPSYDYICDRCCTSVTLPVGHRRPLDVVSLKCPICKE